MKSLQHEIISASAGSGKTYELVRRYLHLLALGVEPERIAAMTFTRNERGWRVTFNGDEHFEIPEPLVYGG